MADKEKVLPTPVDWDELYPGRFIKAGDFKGKVVTLTIAAVKIEELIGDKGPRIKGVLFFEKTEKAVALNKTNGICLKAMFGRMVQEWVGHKVSLHAATWNGDPCIRVYGSPELPEDKVVEIALPRKRPFNMTLHRVQLKGAAPAQAPASAATAPPSPSAAPSLPPPPPRAISASSIDDDADIPF